MVQARAVSVEMLSRDFALLKSVWIFELHTLLECWSM